jgi:transcriptional regulator with XRE-family HTH domain
VYKRKVVIEMGFKIKELREKENLSQAELAQKSGVSQNLIARLESGALTNTTTDTLFKISKALNVKVEQIFLQIMFNMLNIY